MPISPARRSAFEVLRRVESEGAFASVLLARLDSRISENDRALCYELVMGVLRRRLWLDKSIEHFGNRPIEDLDLAVRLGLEIGLYQLRFLSRIPASAAVNESVNLVRARGVKSAAGFVNALLRRATRETDYDPAATAANQVERIAIETSHPSWLIEHWTTALGVEAAESFARANNETPPVCFRFTSRAAAAGQRDEIIDELTANGADLVPSSVTPNAWRVTGAANSVRKLAGAGLIYLQDEASQLISHLLKVEAGQYVLDLAAAPGSKATHISVLEPDATIVAGDLYSHRVTAMRELAQLQGAKISALIHDARHSLPFPGERFDRVLLDAPCSGTGTLRRNPEIRWRLQPGDIDELASQQQTMLVQAARVVRPGGRLIYSTCSVEIQEDEAVIDAFLAGQPDFVRGGMDAPRELQTGAGDLRTWPHLQGVDGFYVAALDRRQ